MRIEDLIMISNVDRHQMNGTIYRPNQIKKIVLVIHGMAEHEQRYKKFAEILAENDCLVLTPDLRGHGRSPMNDTMGHFGNKEGYFKMVRDLHQLINLVRKTYPVEIILFGHSMGSLFALDYLKRYPNHVAGVILTGVPSKNSLAKVGSNLLKPLASIKPKESNKVIQKAINVIFNSEVKNSHSDLDWISYDANNRAAYAADPLCGFPFTNSGYVDLFSLMGDVYSSKPWRIQNENLPIYLLSGMHDPVCNSKGNALEDTKRYIETKGYSRVETKLYANSRHELLLDVDKEEALKDIVNMIKGIVNN